MSIPTRLTLTACLSLAAFAPGYAQSQQPGLLAATLSAVKDFEDSTPHPIHVIAGAATGGAAADRAAASDALGSMAHVTRAAPAIPRGDNSTIIRVVSVRKTADSVEVTVRRQWGEEQSSGRWSMQWEDDLVQFARTGDTLGPPTVTVKGHA